VAASKVRTRDDTQRSRCRRIYLQQTRVAELSRNARTYVVKVVARIREEMSGRILSVHDLMSDLHGAHRLVYSLPSLGAGMVRQAPPVVGLEEGDMVSITTKETAE
jgi:hypothetical protein